MRERETEMISILSSKDRSVSGKILIIQLWSPTKITHFFCRRASSFVLISFSSFLCCSLNYDFFYSVLCVHFDVCVCVFFVPFIGTLNFCCIDPEVSVCCSYLLFSFTASMICYAILGFLFYFVVSFVLF